MARPMKPLVKSGGYYPSRRWTPLVYPGGYTTMNGGEPPIPIEWKTVSGSAPLTFSDALSNEIRSLIQYGKCVTSGVDILCNNGALRYGAMGSNLYDPSTAVFEVGYYYNPKADGAQTAAANNFIYHAYIPIEAGEAYVFYGRKQSDNRISQYNRIHWYAADKTYIGTNTYTAGTIGKGVAPDNAVYARLSCNPQDAGTAISEETVLGYNWTFCKGAAEVTPFVPFVGGVKPVGTPEVLTVSGQNLVDLSAVTNGYYYSPSGVYTALDNARLTDYIPVRAGQKYTVYVQAAQSGVSANMRCNLFNPAKQWKSQSTFSVIAGTADVGIVTPSEDGYLRVSANYTGTGAQADWSTLQIVRGEYTLATMPPYEPYVTPQTVTDIPMLLGVGDYKDEVEIISGIKTGRVGVVRLSPDWTWLKSNTYTGSFYTSDATAAKKKGNDPTTLCTHGFMVNNLAEYSAAGAGAFYWYSANTINYKFDDGTATVAQFKQFLTNNVVLALYPLATETTEQTTPHSLHSYNGTTIVTAQTNVYPVELRVEYKGVST